MSTSRRSGESAVERSRHHERVPHSPEQRSPARSSGSRKKFGKAEGSLLLVSITLAVLVGEGLLRLLDVGVPSLFLMYSSPYLAVDEYGAVRHVSNTDVRSVMTYKRDILFEDRLHTNNLGLVDHRDYVLDSGQTPSGARFAVLGNSFTEGMGGGEPWLPRLRDDLQAGGRDLELYNLGMTGAGVQQFHELLSSVARELTFTHILLVPISEDFRRDLWLPLTSADEIRMCRRDEVSSSCMEHGPAATIIDYNDSKEAILEHAGRLRRSKEMNRSSESNPVLRWIDESDFRLLRVVKRELFERLPRRAKPGRDNLELNFAALKAMQADFPGLPIIIAHFPALDEVRAGRYNVDVERRAADLGIEYFPLLTHCGPWSLDMFHFEGHPNPSGYRNAARCLGQYLTAAD